MERQYVESPTGIIPESLMDKGLKRQVLDYLLAQPWPGEFKVALMHGWAAATGGLTGASEDATLLASGWR